MKKKATAQAPPVEPAKVQITSTESVSLKLPEYPYKPGLYPSLQNHQQIATGVDLAEFVLAVANKFGLKQSDVKVYFSDAGVTASRKEDLSK
jgi:hypothetical protein